MITGILLAAGYATRFGGNKLMHELHGVPMGVLAARNLSAALTHVVAVVHPGDERLREAFRAENIEVVVCENADEGMGASLACGVSAARNADGWVIALGDMPFIQTETISEVAEQVAHGAVIVAPKYCGKRGHPVGFIKQFGPELMALRGDAGARELLIRYAPLMVNINSHDRGVLRDIDTTEDLLIP
ncbi:MAG: nucleotidyltransferase family protein [Burkholderiales bacterium]